MKGIVLATASATSLYPITNLVIKRLLPIYATPILYEPIGGVRMAGESQIAS